MLSKRLQAVFNCIEANLIVADIGTDHAYLPCALIKARKSKFVYACDVISGPLKQAEKNIQAENLQSQIQTILSDGLTNVPLDSQIIVIAGMGWQSAKKILEKDIKRLKGFKQVVIQVNREVSSLRKWISDHHYTIINEAFCFDFHAYQIVVFNTQYHESYSEEENQFGPILLQEKSNEFLEYYQDYYGYLQGILDQCEDKSKVNVLSKEVEMIRVLLASHLSK